ncbi:membrane steroid-binding protein 2-like [Canna indica]|uniref:Membrane steroid-binding protein 2-like n=1 Tax=Canna indica TaxID=4628 RepID=A0AAQ3KLH6_9LILI|nr:membrane steroid-binding protein 2-like [Canna indica]
MAVAEAWEMAKKAIEAYTGMSPATFFTVLAVGVALYHTLVGFLAPPPPPPPRKRETEPLPPPVQLGEITEEELRAYDGSDPKKPLLMAIKSQIYDVSQSRMFYGPGGPYALFAGKDASRALAKMSFEPQDLTSDISGLGPFELDALQDWEYKFMSKYVKVGTIKKEVPATEGSDDTTTSEITEISTHEDAPAETSADAHRSAEATVDDGKVGHDHEAEHPAESPAELNENVSSSYKEEAADQKAELKEAATGEGAKE